MLNYRPQTRFAKAMIFTGVCLSTGGGRGFSGQGGSQDKEKMYALVSKFVLQRNEWSVAGIWIICGWKFIRLPEFTEFPSNAVLFRTHEGEKENVFHTIPFI